MPNTPDLRLAKDYFLVLQGGSVIEGYVTNGVSIGQIRLKYATSDTYDNGDNIAFWERNQPKYSYQGTTYLLVQEQDILFKENYTPAP